jgi:predicted nucleotidyltransferase component of viral defense system
MATHCSRASSQFRGGTALNKLFLKPPSRYSEDLDFVQTSAGPIGSLMKALREVLDPWLGKPSYKRGPGRVNMVYRFTSEIEPVRSGRIKIEINTREHFSVHQLERVPHRVESRWFAGEAPILTYSLDELLGTKLRALYQRKKGRDLFDLATALAKRLATPRRIVECFQHYMEREGKKVSRAEFEANLHAKVSDGQFTADIGPLLPPGVRYDADDAHERVGRQIIALLPGAPWAG